jgi:mono/diheme cytochrome c family protein
MPTAGRVQRLIAIALALASPAAVCAEPPRAGADVFRMHCVLCHGSEGRGDGRAAATLATRPANLTASRLPADEIRRIVTFGGAAVGRSSSMPPWGEALGAAEVDAVVAHVCSIAGSCRSGAAPVAAAPAAAGPTQGPTP